MCFAKQQNNNIISQNGQRIVEETEAAEEAEGRGGDRGP
jgi:hypothetical protein